MRMRAASVVWPRGAKFTMSELSANFSNEDVRGEAPHAEMAEGRQKSFKRTLIVLLLCVLASALCITIVSKCSPLYVFHDGNDVNWFLTMGRGMVNGAVPYKDLFEQKGIYLYMLFALNYIICGNSLYFIYAAEIVCGAAYLFLCYKIISLYMSHVRALAWTGVCALVTFCCHAFWCGGGEVEEYMLPLLTYGVYVLLKSARTKRPIHIGEAFACGAISAIIFWFKYSMLALFGALAVCAFTEACILRRVRLGFAYAGAFVAAFALFSVPALVYLGVNDALGDMWRVYILQNIAYTGGDGVGAVLLEIICGVGEMCLNPFMTAFTVFGAVWMIKWSGVQKRQKVYYLAVLGATVVLQCLLHGSVGYYLLAMAAFVPLGCMGAVNCVSRICAGVLQLKLLIAQRRAAKKGERIHSRKVLSRKFSYDVCAVKQRICGGAARAAAKIKVGANAHTAALCVAAAAAVCLLFGNNTIELFNSKDYYPQFAAAEIIETAEEENGEEYSLLCYKIYDRGFYTVRDETPEFYYFALNLFTRENFPELYDGQESYVFSGKADFVVTELEYWEAESVEGGPLEKYAYVADLSYSYIRSNLIHEDLNLCLLALSPEYGGPQM